MLLLLKYLARFAFEDVKILSGASSLVVTIQFFTFYAEELITVDAVVTALDCFASNSDVGGQVVAKTSLDDSFLLS